MKVSSILVINVTIKQQSEVVCLDISDPNIKEINFNVKNL